MPGPAAANANLYVKVQQVDRDGNIQPGLGNLALCGAGKPKIYSWATGTDSYAAPDEGVTNDPEVAAAYLDHSCGTMVVTCGDNGALLSIGDEADSERPFIIPANSLREISFAEVPVGTRIVAKNLISGQNFAAPATAVAGTAGLYVEIR